MMSRKRGLLFIATEIGLLAIVPAVMSCGNLALLAQSPLTQGSALPLADGVTSEVSVLYVNPSKGDDTLGKGSQSSPFKTITQALQKATSNTVILLAPGTYSTASGEVFPLKLKPTVSLQGDPGTRGRDILIQGGGSFLSPTFALQNITILGASQAGLTGLTVNNPNPGGYGLWIESTQPVVIANTFTGNTQDGIFITGTSAPTIRSNYFYQNKVAGITIAGKSRPELRENVFEDTGDAIKIAQTAAPILIDNQIIQNVGTSPQIPAIVAVLPTATTSTPVVLPFGKPLPRVTPGAKQIPDAILPSPSLPNPEPESGPPDSGMVKPTVPSVVATESPSLSADSFPMPSSLAGSRVKPTSNLPPKPLILAPDSSSAFTESKQPNAQAIKPQDTELQPIRVVPLSQPQVPKPTVNNIPPTGIPTTASALGAALVPATLPQTNQVNPESRLGDSSPIQMNLTTSQTQSQSVTLPVSGSQLPNPQLTPTAPITIPVLSPRATSRTTKPLASRSLPSAYPAANPVEFAAPTAAPLTSLAPGGAVRSSAAKLPVLQSAPILPVPGPNIPLGNAPNQQRIGPSQFALVPYTRSSQILPNQTQVGRYRVVVEAASQPEQALVQKLVPHAFRTILNGQIVMQAGSFSDRNTAKKMQQMLSSNGLKATIEDVGN